MQTQYLICSRGENRISEHQSPVLVQLRCSVSSPADSVTPWLCQGLLDHPQPVPAPSAELKISHPAGSHPCLGAFTQTTSTAELQLSLPCPMAFLSILFKERLRGATAESGCLAGNWSVGTQGVQPKPPQTEPHVTPKPQL